MRSLRRAGLTMMLTLCAALVAAPAQAAGGTGLEVTVRGDDPFATVLVLTNRGAAACQVVLSTLGTVALTRVEQDGTAIEPIPVQAAFAEGLDAVLAAALRTLEPGASVELPLRVVPVGPTGHAIETISWSPSAGAFGTLTPLRPGLPLRLEFGYAVPIIPAAGPAACAPATATADAVAQGSRPAWVLWAVGGFVLLVVLLSVILVVLLLARRRRASTAAAGVLLLAVGLLGAGWSPRPAYATITADPGLKDAFAACSGVLHAAGNDPAGILPTLDGAGVKVSIVAANGDQTHEIRLPDGSIVIFWDPEDRHKYAGTGGNADPCDALYHEMVHGNDHVKGTFDGSECGDSGIPTSEVEAVRAQNKLRVKLGKNPPRSHYGEKPLPTGDCKKKPEKKCEGAGCGHTTGDPHLRTFDGVRYSFQAVGEFVAARDGSGAYEIQVRQQPFGTSRLVSVNGAVAMTVDGDRLEFRITATGMELLVAGAVKPLGAMTLPGGGTLAPTGNRGGAEVSWKDGSTATVVPIGYYGLVLSVEPASARAGKLEGLLGDFDGKTEGDLKARGGAPIGEPTFAHLYPAFADSWRVTGESSLFAYPAGAGTQTYTDRTFPDREVKVDQLPNRAAAEAVCRGLGVTDADALAGCVLDVALTGRPDFAVAAAAGQVFAQGADLGGQRWTVKITTPGAIAQVQFDGTAGQKVFLDVPSTTLPNQCGVLALRGPDGDTLASGCLIGGTGFIDGTVLPRNGRYSIVVDASDEGLGEARLRLITVTDQVGAISPDGAEVLARIERPGAVSRFTFAGTAGQKIFLEVPAATMPNECGQLKLVDPDGSTLASGCVINGVGFIDRAVLPAGGTYAVLVDPNGVNTGEARLRLHLAVDQQAAITIGGAPVTARIAQPGAVSRFDFTGRRNQRIFVEASAANLPNQCGVLKLEATDGSTLASGCVINGEGNISTEGTVLPADGTYHLVLDPGDSTLGEATLRIRG